MAGPRSFDQEAAKANDSVPPEDGSASGRNTGAWTEDAKASIRYIRVKQKVIAARHKSRNEYQLDQAKCNQIPRMSQHEIQVMCESVGRLLDNASKAANGLDPKHRRLKEWWAGTCAEAAYKNIHYAEATLARLYEPREVKSEVLDAVRRARSALSQDDLGRQALLMRLAASDPVPCTADELSEMIAVGHEAADRSRSRLRTFRNLLLAAFVFTGLLLALFVALTAWKPWLVPLCFVHDPSPIEPSEIPWHVCPSGEGHLRQPAQSDVFVVAVLGLIGGVISSGVFVRGLYGNSKPYDVSVPLALLKVPVGGFAAIIGVMLLAGDFVPGFSAVDKQSQILAYALLFGFAQQLLTKMLDERAAALVASVPTKADGGNFPAPRTEDFEALNLVAYRRRVNGSNPDSNQSPPAGPPPSAATTG
jgi:hypothetical protein